MTDCRVQRALDHLRDHSVTLRQAAEIADISYIEMLELAYDEGINVGYTNEDLDLDLDDHRAGDDIDMSADDIPIEFDDIDLNEAQDISDYDTIRTISDRRINMIDVIAALNSTDTEGQLIGDWDLSDDEIREIIAYMNEYQEELEEILESRCE